MSSRELAIVKSVSLREQNVAEVTRSNQSGEPVGRRTVLEYTDIQVKPDG
jgi:hypothetical protein